jgi:putative ABC transport system permease protein
MTTSGAKIRAFWHRLSATVTRRDGAAGFDAELEAHVAMDTEAGVRDGLDAIEARRQALVRMGGAEQARQAYRERAKFAWLEDVPRDVAYCARTLMRQKAATAVAVLTLAIGIGASTAIFSAVKPILISPLPYPHAKRLMMVWETGTSGMPSPVTFGTFYGISQQNHSFDALAVFKGWQPAATATSEEDRPERLDGQRVSADYFRTLGVSPRIGRDFQASDDRFRGPNVVILSDRIWRNHYGSDAAIVGKQVRLDDAPYTVIGVMPSDFENVVSSTAEVWSPLQYNPALPWDGREWGHHLHMIGRLKAGVSSQQAANELSIVLRSLAQIYAKGYDSSGGAPHGMAVHALQDDLTQSVRPALLAVLGAVVLVLLIACVNVANLQLARGVQRRAEFAMRTALGAPRGRLVRQLLAESLLLATIGCAVGMAVASAGVRALLALSPPGLPRLNAISLDGWVFAFALALTTLIGIAVGLISSLQASKTDLQTGVQRSSGRSVDGNHRTRRVLVVTEVSLAVVLLVSAGLLLRSMQRLFAVDPGFDPQRLITMQVQESGHRYDSDAARLQLFQQALENIRRIPGVTAAGFTSQLPLSGDQDIYGVEFEKDHNPLGVAAFRYAVSPGYLEAMRIPLRRGRLLNENDRAGAPVAVLITESLAREEFAGQDPIGQRVRLGPDAGQANKPWATIVGVVGNVKQESLALNQEDAFYTTTAQWAWGDAEQSVVVRASAGIDPATLAPVIQEAIWSVDGTRPITRVATMNELVAATALERRFVLVLFEAFGLVALVLAAIGIYGILAGSVTERTREIGVRAALGATRNDILSLVLRQGMMLTAIGMTIGLCGALAAGRALNAMLFGVTWLDVSTYAVAIALLFAVSGIACLIPARRAASIDPMKALRTE